MSVQIIIDSTVDLKPELLDEVKVARLSILFGSETFVDGATLTKQEFYTKLVSSDVLPTTSQATPFTFGELYKETIEEGNEAIVITISSKLSGTFQSANIASMDYEGQVYVVDSLNAAAGAGVLAEYALRLSKVGLSAKQIYNILEEDKHKLCLIALLDTLDYLHKGGRIPKSVAMAGGLLSIKPLITISEGSISMLGQARGTKKGNALLDKKVHEIGEINFEKPVILGYTGTDDELLQKYIESSDCNWHNYSITDLSGVIGTHVGPGAFAVAFFKK